MTGGIFEMLSKLPTEIIYRIVTFLPTVSALAYLGQTCHRLYEVITAEDSRIFRAFVRSRFPSIETPPFWKDATQALTSRARALDRRAIICRFVVPPPDVKRVGIHPYIRHDRPTIGYNPVINSYECWTGNRWADRREVLSWGAGAELAMRIRECGDNVGEQWFLFNDLHHIDSHDDICGLHLLRPGHPNKEDNKEHLIYGRKRGNLVHVAITPQDAAHECKQTFLTDRTEIRMTDISDGVEPLLAVLSHNGSITFFHTTTRDSQVLPFAVLEGGRETTWQKYSKFLSSDRIAVGTGILTKPLLICDITPNEVLKVREITLESSNTFELSWRAGGAHVTAIAPLGIADQRPVCPGNVFLAGWRDSKVRLHDLRSNKSFEKVFVDMIDTSPIYCVQPFGHDRFVVGAGAHGIVKIFDLRMPHNTYDYTESIVASSHKLWPFTHKSQDTRETNPLPKDFSIFVSHKPLANRLISGSRHQQQRYRGSIYSMSSPSPSSPTIYIGLSGGISRLDFVSTRELTGPQSNWYHDNLGFGLNMNKSVPYWETTLNLSGYERPSYEDPHVIAGLWTQKPFYGLSEEDAIGERESGWDRRWVRYGADRGWRQIQR